MATTTMTPAQLFFYEHAGWSYDPATETSDQGKRRTARQLAAAEEWGKERGLRFAWADDWEIGSHRNYYGPDSPYAEHEPETCEQCLAIIDVEGGEVLASLGCIDDADDNYRRVIEAELALEAREDR